MRSEVPYPRKGVLGEKNKAPKKPREQVPRETGRAPSAEKKRYNELWKMGTTMPGRKN